MSIPKNINILIVDDQESIRNRMREDLKSIGFLGNIFEASNIVEAQDTLVRMHGSRESVQLILSDWEMAGGTGLDFLRIVKSEPKFKKVPFIMITAVNSKEAVLKALKDGANNYVVKPWQKDDLSRKLDETWDKCNP